MRDEKDRKPHPDVHSRNHPRDNQTEQPSGTGTQLFEDRQERLNQFERSSPNLSQQDGDGAGQNEQGLRSRSADPGQSSYGGFTNEDTRQQHQQLDDYTDDADPAHQDPPTPDAGIKKP